METGWHVVFDDKSARSEEDEGALTADEKPLSMAQHGKSFRQPNETRAINEQLARLGQYSARDVHTRLQKKKRDRVTNSEVGYEVKRENLVKALRAAVDEAEQVALRQKLANLSPPERLNQWDSAYPHPFAYSYEAIQKFMQVDYTSSGWWYPTLIKLADIFRAEIIEAEGEFDPHFFVPTSQSVPSSAGDTYQPLSPDPLRTEIYAAWYRAKIASDRMFGRSPEICSTSPDAIHGGEVQELQQVSDHCEHLSWLLRDLQDRLYRAGADLERSYMNNVAHFRQHKYN